VSLPYPVRKAERPDVQGHHQDWPSGYPRIPQMADAFGGTFVYNDDDGLLVNPCHAVVTGRTRTLLHSLASRSC
jgi:hypothetical protein